jgi:tRNA C32,U32 (ribose-2'-O)-methylase TrmJ
MDFKMIMFKRIFGRAELTEREANTLLGMTKLLRWQVNVHKGQGVAIEPPEESSQPTSWP